MSNKKYREWRPLTDAQIHEMRERGLVASGVLPPGTRVRFRRELLHYYNKRLEDLEGVVKRYRKRYIRDSQWTALVWVRWDGNKADVIEHAGALEAVPSPTERAAKSEDATSAPAVPAPDDGGAA